MQSLAALDFDGDGDLDLAVAIEGSGGVLYLNDGTGVFSQARADDLARTAEILALVAFDADGDGDTDLAVGAARENQLFVNRNLYEGGSLTSTLITPAIDDPRLGVSAWRSVQVLETVPPQSQLTYDVLNAGGIPIPPFSNLRPDASGQISLAALSSSAYPAIRLRANLADLNTGPDYNDRTPQLCAWTATFDMAQGHVRFFPFAPHTIVSAQ